MPAEQDGEAQMRDAIAGSLPDFLSRLDQKIGLPYGNRIELVNVNDIIRCEAQDNYTLFHLNDHRQLLSSRSLAVYERKLTDYRFIRVHQSHLVNLRYIRSLIRGDHCQLLLTDQSVVEVSRRKKADLVRYISSL